MKKLCEYGAYLLVFLLPWQTVWIIREVMIGHAGAQGVWQYGTLRIYGIEFLILVLATVYFIQWYRNHTQMSARKNCRWLFDGAWIFFFFAGLSIFWSDDRLVAFFAWVRLLEGAFLFTLFRSTPLKWPWLAGAWIGAAFVQSSLGIWQFAAQMVAAHTPLGIAAHNPLDLGASVIEAGDRRWLRAYGGFPHPNIFGAYLAISVAWCYAALSRAAKKWQWIALTVSAQVILIALLFTFSRSAWLSVFCVSVAGLFFFLKKGVLGMRNYIIPAIHPSVVATVIGVITIGIFSAYFNEEIQTRFGLLQSRLETKSASERILSIERVVPVFQAYWLSGVGVGNFTNTLFLLEEERGVAKQWHTYQPIHNVFLLIFAELGIIGTLLLIIMMLLIVREVYRSQVRVAGCAALVVLLVPALFDHFLWTLPFGVFLIGITLGIVAAERHDPLT